MLAAALDAATDQALIATDDDGRITFLSAGAQLLLGYGPDELLGEPLHRLIDGSELAVRAGELGLDSRGDAVLFVARQGRAETSTWTYVAKDGTPRPVSHTVARLPAGADHPAGFVALATDIRAQVQAESAMRDLDQRFQVAFDNAPIAMALTSLSASTCGRFIAVNRAMCSWLGYTEEQLRQSDVFAISDPADVPAVESMLQRAISGEVSTWQVEKRYRHADGHDVWGLLSTSSVCDDDGRPVYLVSQIEDVTARRELAAELSRRALSDPLTGLANRVQLHERLADALARAERAGTRVAVLFLDLDHFKHVNDALGHEVGDRLLVSVGNRLRACLGAPGIAARIGGDEFVVVEEGVRTPRDATLIAERLLEALAGEHSIGERPLRASIGIALSDGDSVPGQLLREADSAMSRAKHNRASWEMADPELRAHGLRRIDLETELYTALHNGEFVLHYQPSYDLRTGAIVATEALLRWAHPERGLVCAGEFIDVAEESEIIVALGEWVVREACERAAAWQQAYGDLAPRMWVNLSARQLERGDFSAKVGAALAETGLDPARLCLELTERQLLGTAPAATEDLRELLRMGVSLAIDDFGTGYSGLSYLRRLRFAMLKLDRSFVAGVPGDRTDTALTASVIALGRSLDLTLVCEGVETEAQRAHLLELGCQLAQGDALHPPANAQEVDAAIAAGLGDDRAVA